MVFKIGKLSTKIVTKKNSLYRQCFNIFNTLKGCVIRFYVICTVLQTLENNINADRPLFEFKISSIVSAIATDRVNCTSVIEFFLQRCVEYDWKLNTLISMNPYVLSRAQMLDDYYTETGDLFGKLHCIPIIVKDNIDVIGLPTTGGLKALMDSKANRNALVVSRLESEGGIVLAKANMAELAFGLNYDSEMGGICKNPFDLNRQCGISSSGTAASITSGFGIIGIGTDTTGSIIQPSAFNGLFGLRPFYNQDLLNGIIPVFSKQDTVGVVAKHVDDLVLAYSIMYDDETILQHPKVSSNEERLKIKVIRNFMNDFNDPKIEASFLHSINLLRLHGVQLAEDSLDDTQISIIEKQLDILREQSTICMISRLEPSMNKYFNHNVKYKDFEDFVDSPLLSIFWKETFDNIFEFKDTNKDINCNRYNKAREEFKDIFLDWVYGYDDDVGALLVPSLKNIAPFLNESVNTGLQDSSLYLSMSVYTGLAFLAIPIGFVENNDKTGDDLPISMGLIFKKSKQVNAIRIVKLYESLTGFSEKFPTSVLKSFSDFH